MELRGAVNLVAQFAGKRHARQDHRHIGHHHAADIAEFERPVGNIIAGKARQQGARLGAGNGKAMQLIGDIAIGDTRFRHMHFKPAPVHVLGRTGAKQHEGLVIELGHREIAIELALGREHRRQRKPPGFRQVIGEQAVKEGRSAGTLELMLGVIGDLDHAHMFTHRLHFIGYMAESIGPSEGRRFLRLVL